MGCTAKRNGKPRQGSVVRKVLSTFLAVCMVVGLNPACALAGTADTGNTDARYGTSVGAAAVQNAGQGGSVSTDVNVAVTSKFKALVTNEEAVTIADAAALARGEYELFATIEGGVPMGKAADSDGYYEYRWTRQVFVNGEGSQPGTWQDDEAYNKSDAAGWHQAPIETAANTSAKVSLNLNDVASWLDLNGQAHYRYTVIAKDAAMERAAQNSVDVVCSAEYIDTEVEGLAHGTDSIYVRGLIHIGAPQLSVTPLDTTSAANGLFLQKADGFALDGVFDLAITEQQAENAGKPTYLQPLTYIHIPLSSDVPEGIQKSDLKVLGISSVGDTAGLVREFTDFEIVEIEGVRYAQISSGATAENEGAPLVCGAFSVAYKPAADKPPVNVTSEVDGEGGLINIMGTHKFAQGSVVRYTFLPSAGYVLNKVVVVEGNPDSPTSTRTYTAGQPQDNFKANWLDYTVTPSNSANPEDVTITAYFSLADTSGIEDESFMVSASVDAGEGTTSIAGGTDLGNGVFGKTVKAGSAVTVQFAPALGYVLDYVEVTTGEGSAATAERPQVLNNSLTLSAVCANTKVVVHFKEGTPVVFPNVSINYADTTNGTFGEGNPTEVPYGSAAAVQVVTNVGYEVSDVWFTFDSDTSNTKHPLRYSGAGTSWVIDNALENLTVHANFESTALKVKVNVGAGGTAKASYTNTSGTSVTNADTSSGVLELAPTSGLELNVVPDADKLGQVVLVMKDGSRVMVSSTNGKYIVGNKSLKNTELDYVSVEFTDKVPENLSIKLFMSDFGLKIIRTDVGGAGEIPPATKLLENISPTAGLALNVSLLSGYKNLSVTVRDAAGVEIHKAEVGADGGVSIGTEFISSQNTLYITCERDEERPPIEYPVTVTADTDGNGTISPESKTFNSADELANINYTITAADGFTLDYIAVSSSKGEDGVEARIFSGIPEGNGWTFTLAEAFIENGYDQVCVRFKAEPKEGYWWLTPIVVDDSGQPVGGEDAHGNVSPAERFQVIAGGVGTLTFAPEKNYRVEVSVGSINGPWSKVDRLNYSIGMDGSIDEDTNVYARFVYDASAEERDYHTITTSVFGGVGGNISPEGPVQVAHRGNQAFSFIPDAANGYELSYVIVDKGTASEVWYSAEALEAANGQYIFTNVEADHTLTAVFVKSGQLEDIVVWNVSAGDGGSVSPSGAVNALVSEGGRVVEIAADEGYMIDKILLNGAEVALTEESGFVGTSAGGLFTLPAVKGGGGTFYVTFTKRPVQVALHVNLKSTGGTVSPNGDSFGLVGSSQTITFVPDEGYRVAYARYTNSAGNPLTNGDFTESARRGTHTFTLNAETWIECAFEPGETDPVGKTITITAVSVGEGAISPSGTLKLFPDNAESKVTFTLAPHEGYHLAKLTVGERDVTSGVTDDTYTLLAKDAKDGDEVRAVFEKNAVEQGTVELTSGSGGRISPSGAMKVDLGKPLPMGFIPDAGMRVNTVEFTYKNADGTIYKETKTWRANTYTVQSVPENLIEIHVTFAQGSGSQVKVKQVKAVIASGSEGHGTVSPAAGDVVDVVQGANGGVLFTFHPESGYEVASAKLGGKNTVQKGATSKYVTYSELAKLNTTGVAELEIAFSKIEANPDYVNVIVTVTPGVKSRAGQPSAQSGIDVGVGGMVSPAGLQVEYGSTEVYEFYVFPDDGYRLDTLEASVDGGAPVQLDYSTNKHEGASNNIDDIIKGEKSAKRAVVVGAPLEEDGADGVDDAEGGYNGSARHYVFKLSSITGNVDVQVGFVPIGEGEEDDAINGGGKRVQLSVGASEGGFISPSGTVTLPENCTYNFVAEPDSNQWTPAAIIYTYADGTKHIDESVKAGRVPIKITSDLTGIYVVFEKTAPNNTVTVTTSSTGPGSIYPSGAFQIEKGEAQTFTFKFDDKYSYVQQVELKYADGTTEIWKSADGDIWEFDSTLNVYDIDDDLAVNVTFARGTEENPMWDELRYVNVVGSVVTAGNVGDTSGGKITPSAVQLLAGSGSQTFQFMPNRGFIVDRVTVTEGTGDGAKVSVLGAEAMASGKVAVSNVESDTVVQVFFVPTYYTVDVSSGDGGSFNIEGSDIKVRQGQRLELFSTPESGYELDKISTGGLVVRDVQAQESADQVSRVASLGGRAAENTLKHTFAVAGAGSVRGEFKVAQGPTPPGPDNPDNPGGNGGNGGNGGSGGSGVGSQQLTVKVSSSGNGEVTPNGEFSVAHGSTVTLTLSPAVGYYPSSVTVTDAQGTREVANSSRTFAVVITSNTEIVANFTTLSAAGAAKPVNRVVRTLQSLASTGDNAVVGVCVLTGIACVAVGAMLLLGNRRRKKEE